MPEANRGLWDEAPSCWRRGSRGKAPSHQRHGGSGGRAPSAHISLKKITYFQSYFIKNNAFKTWHRNWQRNMIQLVALMGYMGSR